MKAFKLNKGWSDWAKIGAAILVAVSHYSTVICINNQWNDSAFLRFWCQGAYIGVALFFFFSGYGLMESEKKQHLGLKQFIQKRFMKIYLPVLLVSAFWIPLYYWLVAPESTFNLWNAFYDLVWGFQDCVLWFIKILFGMYGLFMAFSLLRAKNKLLLAHSLMLIGTLLAVWLAIQCKFPYISIPLFTIGLYSSLLKEKRVFGMPYSILMLGGLATVYGVFFALIHENTIAHGIINCMITAFVVYAIFRLDRATPPICQNTVYQLIISYT